VPEQLLHRADIVAVLEQVSGKAVAEGMAADVLFDAGQVGSAVDGTLQATGVGVMAAGGPIAGIRGQARGGEEVLPHPFRFGERVFAFEGVGQRDQAVAFLESLLMEEVDTLHVFAEGGDEVLGEHGEAVLEAFAVTNDNLALAEVDVLDAQAEALHEAQPAAIEELGRELVGAGEAAHELLDLFPSEDSGEVVGPTSAQGVEGNVDVEAENVTVEEEQGAEGLVLGWGGDFPIDGEVGEEGLDLGGTHVSGVAFVLVEDESTDPGQVRGFGAERVVFAAERLADEVEELRRGRKRRHV
jgi:hypothetical protein